MAIAIAHLQTAKAEQKALLQGTSLQQAELLSQIATIEKKLGSLGVMRSPHAWVVKSIKWLGQTNQELKVELTLTLGNPDGDQES